MVFSAVFQNTNPERGRKRVAFRQRIRGGHDLFQNANLERGRQFLEV